jgi:hypothetical protein
MNMATEEMKPIQWKTPEPALPPETAALTRLFPSILAKAQTPTWEEKKYIAEEREILERKRAKQDQADMEAFCHIVREGVGNSFLAIRQGAVNAIETIVTTPLDISQEQADEVIITQRPGLLQRFFGGGPQVTQVKR